ncbi:hypothetical protein BGZ94_000952, partial [Podila epigama]
MVHPYFDPAHAATFNEISLKRDSTFEVHYFPLHGLASLVRAVLAVSGAKFSNITYDDWAAEKPKKPFGVIPTLKEISTDGKVIEIAEGDAISRYLSRKFGLLGSNAFEETIINSFVSSTASLHNAIVQKYLHAQSPEAKAEIKSKMLETHIAPWVRYHEQHLADNGTNGHYVGSSLSLADVQTHLMITVINGIWGPDFITEEKNPALWKVKTTIESIPSYGAWTQTDSYKDLTAKNIA